jgi:16S rRNA (cytosine1402-N4)-methyltransferase
VLRLDPRLPTLGTHPSSERSERRVDDRLAVRIVARKIPSLPEQTGGAQPTEHACNEAGLVWARRVSARPFSTIVATTRVGQSPQFDLATVFYQSGGRRAKNCQSKVRESTIEVPLARERRALVRHVRRFVPPLRPVPRRNIETTQLMSENDPDKPHVRRVRYSGTNPRAFHEKYKEHQPERYADDVAKVVAGGKTLVGTHRPIMVQEILEILDPKPGEVAVDCTLGYGGHARELLQAIQPAGRLIAIDADPIELPKAEARLRALGLPEESLVVRRTNYAALSTCIAEEAPEGVDMILADLGLSSMQIDDPTRGFTFKADGPLDMRMNPSRGKTATDLLSDLNQAKLAALLTENADEPRAWELAGVILAAHARRPLTTTGRLAEVIRDSSRSTSDETTRRVFQALRIAVNDELGALTAFLRVLPGCLKPGGRVAILTFHSGEDRRVKLAFKAGFHDGTYASVAEKLLRPSPEERHANPRSSSAKLRYATRA